MKLLYRYYTIYFRPGHRNIPTHQADTLQRTLIYHPFSQFLTYLVTHSTPESSPQSTQIPLEELANIPQVLIHICPGAYISLRNLRLGRRRTDSPRPGPGASPKSRASKPINAIPSSHHERRSQRRRIEAPRQRRNTQTRAGSRKRSDPSSPGSSGVRHRQGGQEGRILRERLVPRASSVCDKELDELGVVFLGDALEVEDFSEVGVGPVGDVDEVGLYEGFGWRGAHLKGFEEGEQAGHDHRDALDVAGWGGRVWKSRGEEVFKSFCEGIGVEKHLVGL